MALALRGWCHPTGAALLLCALLLLSGSGVQAQTSSTPPALPELQQRISELRALLSRLDKLQTDLQTDAHRAGEQADAARDPEQMQRYEMLYQETHQRVRELQSTREELATLLERLQATLDTLPHDP